MAGDTHPCDENSSAPVISSEPRRASESDSVIDIRPSTTVGSQGNGTATLAGRNVDILQMLSKAQDEYDKVYTKKHAYFLI